MYIALGMHQENATKMTFKCFYKTEFKNLGTFLLNGKHPFLSGSGMASTIKSIVGVLLGPKTLSSLKHSVSIICNAKHKNLLNIDI